jgi:hypothetical protein
MGWFSTRRSNDKSTPTRYTVGAHAITCPQCSGQLFRHGKAQLNTRMLSFLDLDWADKSATTLICNQCSNIVWLAGDPTPEAFGA